MDLPLPLPLAELFAMADPAPISRWIALGVFSVLLLLCAFSLRRPGVNKLCVISMVLVLLAMVVNVISALVQLEGVARQVLVGLNTTFVLLILGIAFLLALIGLATWQKAHSGGRKRAVGAMVLCVLLACVQVAGVVMLIQKSGGFEQTVGTNSGSGGGSGLSKLRANHLVAFEKYNFEISVPDSTWVPMKPGAIQPDACMIFRKGDIYMGVIGETDPAFLANPTAAMGDAVKSNMAAEMTVISQHEKYEQLGEDQFLYIESLVETKKLRNVRVHFEQWVLARNGYAWQISIWGAVKDQAEIRVASRQIAESFRIRHRDAQPKFDIGSVNVSRPELGYAVDLTDAGWVRWEHGGEDGLQELADFGATVGGACFEVIPYRTSGTEPPELEALARAFLSTIGFEYDRQDAQFATRNIQEPLPGLEIRTQREVDGRRFRYHFRILQGEGMAWLVGGWSLESDAAGMDKLAEAMDRAQFHKPGTEVETEKPAESKELVKARAEFSNALGLWHFENRDWPRAEHYFREAVLGDGLHFTYTENAILAMEKQGRAREALNLLEERMIAARHEKTQAYQVREAWLWLKTGAQDQAREKILSLIKDGYRDHDEVLDFINEMLDQDRNKDARMLANAYALAVPEPRPRLWQAEVTQRDGDDDTAMHLMEALARDEPDYMAGRYSYGEMANKLGRHEKALEIAEQLTREGHNTARLENIRGWAYMGRKWYREAKTSFEKAVAQDSTDEDAKYGLEEASASLGQGSNSEIKTPLDAVPLPEELTARLEKLREQEPAFGEGANAAYLLRATCIAFSKEECMRTTQHRRVRILNEEGAGYFSSVRYSFDPAVEQFFINRVEVRDESGEVVAKAAVDDAYVLDNKEGIITSGRKAVHIQVPGLKPGYFLDIEVTTKRWTKRDTLPLKRDIFGSSLPIQLEAWSVTGDVTDIQYHLANPDAVQVTRSDSALVFQVSPAPLLPDEDYTAPLEKFAPALVIGSSKTTWEELGADYLKELADRLRPDPEIEQQARDLTKDLTDTRAKVRVLANFVQKSVRYQAIEFGVRGVIPHPPAQTLSQRYGDCKDQSLLLHHLLRACDVPSYLALIDTEWDMPLQPPSMDHFDHMVLHVPDLKDVGIVDPTETYMAVADYPPDWLAGKSFLILDPAKCRFGKVPPFRSGEIAVASRRVISPADADAVRIVEELTLRGYYAGGMRSSFMGREPQRRFQYAQEILDGNGNYRLEDFEFINLEDATKPAILKLTYLAPNSIVRRQDHQRLRLPDPWEVHYLRLPYLKDRVTPFRWRLPFAMSSEVTFDLALGVTPEVMQTLTGQAKSRFGIWKLGQPPKTGAETPAAIKFAFACEPGIFPPADYVEFHAHWTSALDVWGREIEISPTAASSSAAPESPSPSSGEAPAPREPKPEKPIAAPAIPD